MSYFICSYLIVLNHSCCQISKSMCTAKTVPSPAKAYQANVRRTPHKHRRWPRIMLKYVKRSTIDKRWKPNRNRKTRRRWSAKHYRTTENFASKAMRSKTHSAMVNRIRDVIISVGCVRVWSGKFHWTRSRWAWGCALHRSQWYAVVAANCSVIAAPTAMTIDDGSATITIIPAICKRPNWCIWSRILPPNPNWRSRIIPVRRRAKCIWSRRKRRCERIRHRRCRHYSCPPAPRHRPHAYGGIRIHRHGNRSRLRLCRCDGLKALHWKYAARSRPYRICRHIRTVWKRLAADNCAIRKMPACRRPANRLCATHIWVCSRRAVWIRRAASVIRCIP